MFHYESELVIDEDKNTIVIVCKNDLRDFSIYFKFVDYIFNFLTENYDSFELNSIDDLSKRIHIKKFGFLDQMILFYTSTYFILIDFSFAIKYTIEYFNSDEYVHLGVYQIKSDVFKIQHHFEVEYEVKSLKLFQFITFDLDASKSIYILMIGKNSVSSFYCNVKRKKKLFKPLVKNDWIEQDSIRYIEIENDIYIKRFQIKNEFMYLQTHENNLIIQDLQNKNQIIIKNVKDFEFFYGMQRFPNSALKSFILKVMFPCYNNYYLPYEKLKDFIKVNNKKIISKEHLCKVVAANHLLFGTHKKTKLMYYYGLYTFRNDFLKLVLISKNLRIYINYILICYGKLNIFKFQLPTLILQKIFEYLELSFKNTKIFFDEIKIFNKIKSNNDNRKRTITNQYPMKLNKRQKH